MSKVLIIIIVIIVLGFAGWMLLGKNGVPLPVNIPGSGNPQQQAMSASLPKQVEVSLNTLNNSSELGSALLQKVNGKLVVKISLKGEPQGSSQPAHIHLGSCPNPGVVKYPLNPVVNGTSETLLDTTGDDLLKMMPLSINVHMSDKDMKTYVACGDIKL